MVPVCTLKFIKAHAYARMHTPHTLFQRSSQHMYILMDVCMYVIIKRKICFCRKVSNCQRCFVVRVCLSRFLVSFYFSFSSQRTKQKNTLRMCSFVPIKTTIFMQLNFLSISLRIWNKIIKIIGPVGILLSCLFLDLIEIVFISIIFNKIRIWRIPVTFVACAVV